MRPYTCSSAWCLQHGGHIILYGHNGPDFLTDFTQHTGTQLKLASTKETFCKEGFYWLMKLRLLRGMLALGMFGSKGPAMLLHLLLVCLSDISPSDRICVHCSLSFSYLHTQGVFKMLKIRDTCLAQHSSCCLGHPKLQSECLAWVSVNLLPIQGSCKCQASGRRPGWNSRLLAVAWPALAVANIWGVNQQMDTFFHLPLCLSNKA